MTKSNTLMGQIQQPKIMLLEFPTVVALSELRKSSGKPTASHHKAIEATTAALCIRSSKAARQPGVSSRYLHEVLLGLINSSNIIKSDACGGLHGELGLGFAKVEGVVSTRTAHATLRAAGQQEQTTHQQQWECQVACSTLCLIRQLAF